MGLAVDLCTLTVGIEGIKSSETRNYDYISLHGHIIMITLFNVKVAYTYIAYSYTHDCFIKLTALLG